MWKEQREVSRVSLPLLHFLDSEETSRTSVWPGSPENTFLLVFTIVTILTVFYKFTATKMIHCKHLSKLLLFVLLVYKTAKFAITTEVYVPYSPCSATGEATAVRSPRTAARE